MKTILKFTLLFVILFAFSCSTESTEPILDNSDATNLSSKLLTDKNAKAKKVTRSISNSIVLVDYPEAGECGGFKFNGIMTHMGKIEGIGVSRCNDDPFSLNFISDDVIVAANGDKVFTTSNTNFIFLSETEATYTGNIEITGGTGRFYGATGWLVIENAVFDLTTGGGSHNAHGEITY